MRAASRIRGALTAALVAAAAAFAAQAKAEVTVLRDFTLIDGTGRAPLSNAALIMDNGRIRWVGPAKQLKAPKGAQTVRLPGKYVMPGIIDLHVHVGNVADVVQDKKFHTRENVENDLKTYAAYGVTTVQSMGTDQDLIFQVRKEQRAGRPAMARVYTAGQGFVFKGGYGGLVGVNEPISSVSEVDAAVARQAAKGVDLIKLWLDDELGTMPKMPPEMTQAIIDSAHRRGLRVVGHIFYLEDAKRLVRQGIDGLAHSVRDKPVDQELIDMMKARGTWQLAETLSREASLFVYGERAPFLDDPFFRKAVSPRTVEILADPKRQQSIQANPHFHDLPKFLAMAQRNLKTLADAGVNYGYGTDAGPPARIPGFFEHWELELMVQAGFTPAQAIHAATGRAAEFLRANDLGVLERGRWGDLVVLDANPLADIKNTRRINAVYVAGRKVPSVADR
jgi:imidazolonepropionase-like amidohydrolase